MVTPCWTHFVPFAFSNHVSFRKLMEKAWWNFTMIFSRIRIIISTFSCCSEKIQEKDTRFHLNINDSFQVSFIYASAQLSWKSLPRFSYALFWNLARSFLSPSKVAFIIVYDRCIPFMKIMMFKRLFSMLTESGFDVKGTRTGRERNEGYATRFWSGKVVSKSKLCYCKRFHTDQIWLWL